MKDKDKDKKPKSAEAQAEAKEMDSLRQELERVQAERDDLLGKLQRVSADYANFQKRSTKQIQDSVAYEKEKIIKSLLPAVDNFEHMLAKSHAAECVAAVIEGVRIIYDQMMDILKGHGVEQIQALDETFDPTHHEAMLQQADPDKADGVVLQEFQKGYKLHGRVIRPSRVIVNKTMSQEASPAEETPEAASEEPPEGDETTDTE
ncbi:MAG: nucleotide exchange factor GrpE [Sedimentisphaerales bacterium]|nr:nucleotide exchange factor GrpE [Sedimentisphaerales bacterium]